MNNIAGYRVKVTTDALPPYDIKWQVVNTGGAAATANDLRGDFYDTDDWGELGEAVRWERTSYVGTHWVEALILKRGQIVARSGRFIVMIRNR